VVSVPTPIFLNTGGGIFGAIRTMIMEDQNLFDAFGDRVYPGRARSGQVRFPYVALTHVSATIYEILFMPSQGDVPGDRYDTWQENIQVSVYGDNYEAVRQLGRLLHVRISRQTMLADCIEVTLFAQTRMLTIDPNQVRTGADVWHYDFRYKYWTGEKLLADQYYL
jgi:hypothetical protein